MNVETESLTRRLREARLTQGVRQAELSRRAGVPQSHISRIEANTVDLRVSSLLSLARALDMEVVLTPRQALPAVQSIIRQLGAGGTRHLDDEPRPAYTLGDGDDDD